MIDSTSVRSHRQATTAKKRGQIQIIVSVAAGRAHGQDLLCRDAQGLPIRLDLTAGQMHDGEIADHPAG
jgi:transposase